MLLLCSLFRRGVRFLDVILSTRCDSHVIKILSRSRMITLLSSYFHWRSLFDYKRSLCQESMSVLSKDGRFMWTLNKINSYRYFDGSMNMFRIVAIVYFFTIYTAIHRIYQLIMAYKFTALEVLLSLKLSVIISMYHFYSFNRKNSLLITCFLRNNLNHIVFGV